MDIFDFDIGQTRTLKRCEIINIVMLSLFIIEVSSFVISQYYPLPQNLQHLVGFKRRMSCIGLRWNATSLTQLHTISVIFAQSRSNKGKTPDLCSVRASPTGIWARMRLQDQLFVSGVMKYTGLEQLLQELQTILLRKCTLLGLPTYSRRFLN